MREARHAAVAVALCLLAVAVPIAATAAPDDTVDVSQSVEDSELSPGERLSLELAVEVDDADAPGLNLTLPDNWSATVEDDDDARRSGSGYEWLWTDDDDHTVSLTVRVPRNASEGEYEIRTTASAIYEETGERATETTTDTVEVGAPVQTPPPTAVAGDNRTVDGGVTVELDGNESTVATDDVSYRWVQVAGPSVSLSDAETPVARFESPTLGENRTLAFELRVTDAENQTATDRVGVTVRRVYRSPTADAGANLTTDAGATVQLNGTDSSDPDGDALTYEWTQIGGPNVTLMDPSDPTPTFEAPEMAEEQTVTFTLTVEDSTERTATDRVGVTVRRVNRSPTADAGANLTTDAGATIQLDGTGSSDPDGDALTYEWTQTGGPNVTLTDPSDPTPTFDTQSAAEQTTVTFALTVTDGAGGTDTDRTAVTLLGTGQSDDSGDEDGTGSDDDSNSGESDGGDDGSDSGGNASPDDGGSGGSDDASERRSGGGGGSSPPARSEPTGPRVSVDRPDAQTAIVNVLRAPTDDALSVSPNVSAQTLTYDRLRFAPARAPAILTVGGPDAAPFTDPGIRPLGTVTTDARTAGPVTLTVGVPTSAVDAETAPTVTAYRTRNGSVTPMTTTLVNESGGYYRYQVNATTPSQVTFGVPVPAIAVTDVRANASRVAVGDPVALTMTVANEGRRAGSEAVTLVGAGDPVERAPAVEAGGTATETVVHRFESPGTYTVSAGDANTTVTVVAGDNLAEDGGAATEGDTGTPATATADSVTGDGPDRTERTTAGDGPGFGVVVTIVAVLTALLARRRR
ncbi:PKD domain-containing protein [Haloarcula marina]|uniref:PKD domain-containing protein n=1 Tax=Haloarcula marina TaxID=2961574 RepID=UPI0020B7E512|nr:PKD domain-containing protein [Halomicroarcula marina]